MRLEYGKEARATSFARDSTRWLIGLFLVMTVNSVAAQSEIIEVGSDRILVYPIRHGTMVLQSGGKTLFVDPVGAEEVFEYFGEPDRILVTDAQADHVDVDLIVALTVKTTTIVATRSVFERLPLAERAQTSVLESGGVIEEDDIGIEAVSVSNPDPKRTLGDRDGGNGYIVTLAGERIFISGDVEDVEDMRALEDIDIAFVSMNVGVATAADAVLDFKPAIVYPYRYRGREMLADVDSFRDLVSADSSIEVHQLDWYPEDR